MKKAKNKGKRENQWLGCFCFFNSPSIVQYAKHTLSLSEIQKSDRWLRLWFSITFQNSGFHGCLSAEQVLQSVCFPIHFKYLPRLWVFSIILLLCLDHFFISKTLCLKSSSSWIWVWTTREIYRLAKAKGLPIQVHPSTWLPRPVVFLPQSLERTKTNQPTN